MLVDDQAMVREGPRLLLESNADIHVAAEFSDGRGLLAYLGLDAGGASPAARPAPAFPAYVELLGTVGNDRLVLLLDMVMPGADGMTVLERLRDHPDRDRLPVLILTTFGGDASVRHALALGANGYVLKDGTADQLATAVRAVADGLTTVLPSAAEEPRSPSDVEAANLPRSLTSREAQVLDLIGEGNVQPRHRPASRAVRANHQDPRISGLGSCPNSASVAGSKPPSGLAKSQWDSRVEASPPRRCGHSACTPATGAATPGCWRAGRAPRPTMRDIHHVRALTGCVARPECRVAGLFRFTIDSNLHAADLRKRKLALECEPLCIPAEPRKWKFDDVHK